MQQVTVCENMARLRDRQSWYGVKLQQAVLVIKEQLECTA